jgi:uncharacterized protein
MTNLSKQMIGIGLRQPHYQALRALQPKLAFLEVHAENYFHQGGASLAVLQEFRQHYDISLHGVGLALASTTELDMDHLTKFKHLIADIAPIFISEHLCWGKSQGISFNDLLPIPYTHETLHLVCARVSQIQDILKREIFIENLSYYLDYQDNDFEEFEFLAQLSKKTGCKLLLDINNLYVNSQNFTTNPLDSLTHLTLEMIGEIHLAGHCHTNDCIIDTHDREVAPEVWQLYQQTLQHFKPTAAIPTLIEWDANLPELSILLAQAAQAYNIASSITIHERPLNDN